MKFTLLEIVQDVLSDMSGDFVNSIDDTEESQQVAAIVRSTFNSMLSNRNWPHTAKIINITPYSDSNYPTHVKLESPIKELISIYYDKRKSTTDKKSILRVKWKDPDDFLRYVYSRNSQSNNTDTITDPTGVILLIDNNKAPDYFTSFDDDTLVFDSYDSDVDSTIQASKTTVRAYVMPEFRMVNDYVPDLPDEAFAALIAEVKSRAQFELRQIVDQKSEQDARKQDSWLSRKAWRAKGGIKYPDYGRRRGTRYYRDPTFRQDR
jgi:hypothetical protein